MRALSLAVLGACLAATTSGDPQPGIFVDGAFRHRPFVDQMYGFEHKKQRVAIPDQGGLFSGQETWVDIARCCAATPHSSDLPMDDAQAEGACVVYTCGISFYT